MTTPTEPTPGAPAANNLPAPPVQPPGPAPAPAAPPATPPPAPGQPAATPPWERDGQPFDPAKAWGLIENLRAENAKLKGDKQTDQQARDKLNQDVAKLLGLAPGSQDPAVLAQHLQTAQDAAYRAAVELAVYRSAGTLGARPDALLDSLAFINSLDDIEADPGSDEFNKALEAKVQEAVARNPNLGQAPTKTPPSPAGPPAGPRPDPSQGTRGTPTATRPRALSEAVKAHYAPR